MTEASYLTRAKLRVGLVNNMGDAALTSTERQFSSLLDAAGQKFAVSLRCFAFNRTARSAEARDYITAHYEPAAMASQAEIDALIITGAQPRATRLIDEPDRDELIELIKWARDKKVPTILSCLAAHAGVLYLDGIERRPLSQKLCGVFTFSNALNHVLVGQKGAMRLTPHSRHNQLLEEDLVGAGYNVLTHSPTNGVDAFAKVFGTLFVFLQGHPEYDVDSLAREYRRDMGQYLRGELDHAPLPPVGYFSEAGERDVRVFAKKARGSRCAALMDKFPEIGALQPGRAAWRGAGIEFYRNWIGLVAAARAERLRHARFPEVFAS